MPFRKIATLSLCLLGLLSVPLWAQLGFQNILTKVLIGSLFAMSFNFIWGQGGLLSFGQSAYFAVGSFAAIYAMGAAGGTPIPLPLVPLVGLAAGLATGLIAGWFATKRSGIYFSMISFAIAELVNVVAYQWDDVFGGEAGLRARRHDWLFLKFQSTGSVYLLTLAWMALSLAAIWWIQRGPLGLVIRGLREREERIGYIGYNTHAIKVAAFTIAAGFSGVAGALLAISDEAASVSLFSSQLSTSVVLNTIIGGTASFFGPVLGSTVTVLFSYYVGGLTPYWGLYLGLTFVAIVLFFPQGLGGIVASALEQSPRTLLAPSRLTGGAAALCFILATVIVVELVGTMSRPEYSVLHRRAGMWPPVQIFGVAWSPVSPLTFGTIVAGYGACFLLAGNRLAGPRARVSAMTARCTAAFGRVGTGR
jgi:branched-chain amino acid transport system permease protein